MDNHLAGTMFWQLSGDKAGDESLVKVAASALGALDKTPNQNSYVSAFCIVCSAGAEPEAPDTLTVNWIVSARTGYDDQLLVLQRLDTKYPLR